MKEKVSLHPCIYIYIYMSTTWQTRSRYVIFWLYFSEIHSFAPAFISEESFRPEEFFVVLLVNITTISKRFEFPGPKAASEFFKLESLVFIQVNVIKAKLTNPFTKMMDFCSYTHNPHDLTQE